MFRAELFPSLTQKNPEGIQWFHKGSSWVRVTRVISTAWRKPGIATGLRLASETLAYTFDMPGPFFFRPGAGGEDENF